MIIKRTNDGVFINHQHSPRSKFQPMSVFTLFEIVSMTPDHQITYIDELADDETNDLNPPLPYNNHMVNLPLSMVSSFELQTPDGNIKAIISQVEITHSKDDGLTSLKVKLLPLVGHIKQEAGFIKPTPNDEDMSMVRVPWTLLAALDTLVAHAGNDKTIVAKELRKYTDDDAEVRLSGAEAFYQEHTDG